MDPQSKRGVDRPCRRRCLAWGLAATAVFLAVWLPWHPARPCQPTADAFTHLSVARHLVRGDGFVTDIAYPLSFAFDFARELPQPLVHRQPGFALLLTAPVAAAGQDPDASLRFARWFQVGLLGLTILIGAYTLLRRRLARGIAPWLILTGSQPLVGYAVDWIFVETVTGLILLVLWTRAHRAPHPRWLDGLWAGILVLLRLDLFWVPLLWWIRKPQRSFARTCTAWLPALMIWVVVLAPWAVRTERLTGSPFFSLQAHAEHVKDTRDWPLYSVYRGLEPQPLASTIAADPEPYARKMGRGLKFFVTELPNLVPFALLVLLVWSLVLPVTVRGAPPGSAFRPLTRIAATLGLLVVQYSLFDHSLRHLLVLFPVLAWEGSVVLAHALPDRRGLFAAAAAVFIVVVTPARLPGWRTAEEQAVAAVPETAARIARFRLRTEPVLFVPDGSIPWYLDRPAVWDPGDQIVRDRITGLLAKRNGDP